MTTETEVTNEINDLSLRVSALERLILNLVRIEKIHRSKLSSRQKELLEKTLSDIQKGDYRNYLTVEEVRKRI